MAGRVHCRGALVGQMKLDISHPSATTDSPRQNWVVYFYRIIATFSCEDIHGLVSGFLCHAREEV
jgi:hypothetical protein